MDLTRGLNQVLKVCPGKEVPEVDEFAVILVLDIDDAPSVLSAANLLAINNDRFFAADNGEGDNVLDGSIGRALFIVELIVVVGIHFDVVEVEFLLYSLLEGPALLQGQRIGLGDNRDDVDNVGQLLENYDIDWLQGMARWLDEEEAAVDAGILNVSFSLGGKLFAEIG